MATSGNQSGTARIVHLLACAYLTVLAGCTTTTFVQLREIPHNPILERLKHSPLGGRGPSARSEAFLAATAYTGENNPVQLIHHCRLCSTGQHRREALHTASEISYLTAERSRTSDPALSMELMLDAAHYAWLGLTDLAPSEANTELNPADLETLQLYNVSVQELMRLVKRSGKYQTGQPVRLPISRRLIGVTIPHPSEWLTGDQLGDFEFVADYELKNLRNRHTTEGIGVPIIVQRKRQPDNVLLEEYYQDGLSFPVSVIIRFPSGSLPQQTASSESGRFELYDPRDTTEVTIEDVSLSLESDLSTPLAYFLTNPDLSLLDTFAFFRSDKAQHLEGLYMVQPFDPNRIPVLMVHGIWSSPVTWMEMFNDLQSDPVLREKYQFWFYMYPTGSPLSFAAADLRDCLKELRLKLDPGGQNAKLDQMVVVGHSMGGLMSYLLTIDSEDRLWNAMSRVPVEEIRADEETRQDIQRVFFFHPESSVDRIVTIASPFNGSGYANRFTQWLSGGLVSLPTRTSYLSKVIYRQNHHDFWDRVFAPRTSLDSLNRHSAILRLVNETTVPDQVRHHNVIGARKGRSLSDWTDGVVKATSAHRDDADSEIQVRASHSDIHRHPQTIAEVRRVLLEHLAQVNQIRYPIRTVGETQAQPTAGDPGAVLRL
ncbi:MAG: alpha/beta fold hydrolase [Planctomycetaceae bacterium]|nr:alpha/beta fold hydrolase [Planctomycetaceae bacterium]